MMSNSTRVHLRHIAHLIHMYIYTTQYDAWVSPHMWMWMCVCEAGEEKLSFLIK